MKAHTNTLKTSHDDEKSSVHDDEKQKATMHIAESRKRVRKKIAMNKSFMNVKKKNSTSSLDTVFFCLLFYIYLYIKNMQVE